MPSFPTADSHYMDIPGLPVPARSVFIAYSLRPPSEVPVMPEDVKPLVADPDAIAYSNGGRWVADCVYSPCTGATLASFADKRFICPYCMNGGTGRYLSLRWPSSKVLEQIEQTLESRPAANRNWRPAGVWDDFNEDVAFLRAENSESPWLVSEVPGGLV